MKTKKFFASEILRSHPPFPLIEAKHPVTGRTLTAQVRCHVKGWIGFALR